MDGCQSLPIHSPLTVSWWIQRSCISAILISFGFTYSCRKAETTLCVWRFICKTENVPFELTASLIAQWMQKVFLQTLLHPIPCFTFLICMLMDGCQSLAIPSHLTDPWWIQGSYISAILISFGLTYSCSTAEATLFICRFICRTKNVPTELTASRIAQWMQKVLL